MYSPFIGYILCKENVTLYIYLKFMKTTFIFSCAVEIWVVWEIDDAVRYQLDQQNSPVRDRLKT